MAFLDVLRQMITEVGIAQKFDLSLLLVPLLHCKKKKFYFLEKKG
jgi:hypothetical protein